MDFKGLSNAVTNTHPLLPSMGTTRQKSSCRNGLQNGPRLLSRVKAGTHSPSPTGSHTAAYTPKQGPSGQGRYHYPRRIPHVHEHPRAGCQNGKLCRFWVLAGGALPKNAESLRSSDALMRVAAPRRRGPAGLRNLFRFCRNRDLYIRRSWFSACARWGWYYYPRRALRAAETLDGRLSKRLTCRFLALPDTSLIPAAQNIVPFLYRCQKDQRDTVTVKANGV